MSTKREDRRVEYLDLESLRADPRNPKDHAKETIAESMGRFGLVDLIVRDDRTGYLVGGHGRVEALKELKNLGEDAPDGVHEDSEGAWLVPVVVGWSSGDDLEAGAALIALNRTTELGGWDDRLLLEQLEELEKAGSDFEGVGFDSGDLDSLRGTLRKLETKTQDDGGWVEDTRDEVSGTSGLNPDGKRSDEGYRLLVASLPPAAYAWASEQLKNAKTRLGSRSNAETALLLVGEAFGEEVPREYLEGLEDEEEEWG